MKRLYWTCVTFWRIRKAVNLRMPGAPLGQRVKAMRLVVEEMRER